MIQQGCLGVLFISLGTGFKDFDQSEKIDDIARSTWSKIWIVLVDGEETGKADCEYTLSDEALEECKDF